MAKPRALKTLSCLLLCGCLFGCGGPFARIGSLMSFEMEDQFRNPHSDADFKGRVLVVIGGDREGASAAENWGKALARSLKPEMDSGRLSLVGLSNLKGVPFFLRGYVRGKFSQNPCDWALLDWKGLFAGSYGFIPGNANILVFDKEGALLYQAHFSECHPDQVLSLTEIVRSKLRGPSPPGLAGCPGSTRNPLSPASTTGRRPNAGRCPSARAQRIAFRIRTRGIESAGTPDYDGPGRREEA